jgi:hypothetical protein
MRKLFIFGLYLIIFAIASQYIYTEYREIKLEQMANSGGVPMAIKNYKKEVDSLAEIFKLPPDYLMALIMLESSGRKKVPVRFESKIYHQLKQLKDGKIDKFENLKQSDLKGVKDKTLKALASSYGPFQIMGYKKYVLNITLDELKGKNNMYYAVKWIDLTYGDLVRDGEYKDAFHIHNAGKKYPPIGKPITHDPDYVKNGLSFSLYFKKIIYK